MAEVVDTVAEAETRLATLHDSNVPAQPDRHWVDNWLHRSHIDYWTRPHRC